VLVLDHAGDRAKWPVGDVPSDGAAELTRVDAPGLTVWSQWDEWCLRRAELRVQVVAKVVKLTYDLSRDVILAAPAVIEHAPQCIATPAAPDGLGQELQHADGLGDRLNSDPSLGLATHVATLVDGAPDPVALDEAILAALDVEASGTHGLHLGIAHAGQVGADDIAGGLYHALLDEQHLGVEARSPGLVGIWIDRNGSIHAAGLGADNGDGVKHKLAGRLAEQHMLGRFGLRVDSDVQVNEVRVDRRRFGARRGICARHTVVGRGPDRHATAAGADLVQIEYEPRVPALAAYRLGEAAVLCDQPPLPLLQGREFGAGGEDVGREHGDVLERALEEGRDHVLGQARCLVLAADLTGAGNQERRAPLPRQ
jgi:hypothetical protein